MSASSISALLALTLTSPVGVAQPLSLQHRAPVPEASAAPTTVEAEAAGETATSSEAPDANADITAAQSQRRAEASAENWEAEGDALSAKGERAAAIAAYTEALARAGSGPRAEALQAKIDATYETPAGELPGTQVAAAPDEPAPASPVADASTVTPAATSEADVQSEPITKRWYFWVTVVAITASAGAITGIAAKAAIDERKATRSDAAPGMGSSPAMGPTLLRF